MNFMDNNLDNYFLLFLSKIHIPSTLKEYLVKTTVFRVSRTFLHTGCSNLTSILCDYISTNDIFFSRTTSPNMIQLSVKKISQTRKEWNCVIHVPKINKALNLDLNYWFNSVGNLTIVVTNPNKKGDIIDMYMCNPG